jgi:hypothetical protein
MSQRLKRQRLIGVLMLFAFSACTSTPSAPKDTTPSWVVNPPKVAGFVYGVGSYEIIMDVSDALKLAQDQARADLIKNMRVSISAETVSVARKTVVNGKSQVTRSLLDSVRSKVENTEISGIEIVKNKVDKKHQRVYSLVRLNRAQAELELQSKLTVIDQKLAQFSAVDSGLSRVQQLKKLLPALTVFAERDRLEKQISLVASMGTNYAISPALQNIQQTITDLLDAMSMKLVAVDQGSAPLASILRQQLTQMGIKLVDDGAVSDFILGYRVSLTPAFKDNTYFVYAEGSVNIQDISGKVLGEFQKKVKGVATDEGVAKSRAINKLAKKLASILGEKLLDVLI